MSSQRILLSSRLYIGLIFFSVAFWLLTVEGCAQLATGDPCSRSSPPGYTDTPRLPGQPWRVHDVNRPHPPKVTPGDFPLPVPPPSDAIVLFDGTKESLIKNWLMRPKRRGSHVELVEPIWKVVNGYMEITPGSGHLVSKAQFGNIQLHIEWATPEKICGSGQWRGNSGVLLMGLYEVQVLDSYSDDTYADGQAGAIYGQWPPLVNASRPPGAWQSYDIIFEAPKFENGRLVRSAYITVFHNGVLIHHHRQILGPMAHRVWKPYRPHPPKGPLVLQDHGTPVRYRNIWIRPLPDHDHEELPPEQLVRGDANR